MEGAAGEGGSEDVTNHSGKGTRPRNRATDDVGVSCRGDDGRVETCRTLDGRHCVEERVLEVCYRGSQGRL